MQRKNFDHITVNALEIISDKGMVKKFIKDSGLTLCDECAVPVSEVRRRFDQFTERTEGIVYTREFFEMILLTSLPDLGITSREINEEDVDCFYGIDYAAVLDETTPEQIEPPVLDSDLDLAA